jgi:hypothetical protein
MEQKQEEEAAEQAERFESIPWASLVPDNSSRNRRVVIIGVTVVVGVVIGLVGGRIVRSAAQPAVVMTLPPMAAPETVAAPDPAVPVTPVDVPLVDVVVATTGDPGPGLLTPLPPQLYSEADLMAVLPEEEMRTAVMRAEWFVTDFFTVDGESSAIADISAALPDGHGAAPFPHSAGGSGISYVEWARAYFVEPLGPARYRVSVAFRTLAGPAVGNLVRTPVRAVTVDIEVGPDGATGVSDFPSPAPAPPSLALPAIDTPDMDAPPDILASALQSTSGVGTNPAPFLTGLDDEGWRIVVLIGDESGLRWPLVVRR